MTLIDYRRRLDRLLAQYRHVKQSCREEKEILKKVKKHLEHALQAQQLVQQVAEQVQNQAHRQVASVVTKCLKDVFGEEYGFRIDFKRRRGRTEAELIILKGNLILRDPVNECGGGVVDVCSFALRLVALVLSRPKKRQLLVLDEPMKHLSCEFRPAVKELLLALSKELGIQMIVVTHSPELAVGKVIELGD